jgi:hypothetical protein
MPVSIDPQPAENEFECANCGGYFYYELTRCPHCGINIYDPEKDDSEPVPQKSFFGKIRNAVHDLFNKPYSAEDVFGNALDASIFYNDLLQKVGGDHSIVEQLIEFEQKRAPGSTRKAHLQSAIARWQADQAD